MPRIRVARLCRLYPPKDILEAFGLPLDLSWVETTKPLARHRDYYRGPVYHQRRIRHFVDRLRAGAELDPIEVANDSWYGRPQPVPVLLDGHHRLIAYYYVRRQEIPAVYRGTRALLRYLEGKTNKP